MLFLLLSVSFSTSSTVPCFINSEELQNFYARIQKSHVSVRYYKEKGLGLMLNKKVRANDRVLCIGEELALTTFESSPISEFTQGLNSIEKLASRVLFERFMGTPGDFYQIYANSLPDTVKSPLQWPEACWSLLKRFSLFSNIDLRLDLSTSYSKIQRALTKIHRVNELMLKNETIDWAMRTVLSRYLTLTDSELGEIQFLGPYIDLINHWPSIQPKLYPPITKIRDMICVSSQYNGDTNEELLIDYGSLESYNFFFRYLMNPRKNPNDLISFKYKNKGQGFSEYLLESSRINLQLLEALTMEAGTYIKIDKGFRFLYINQLSGKKSNVILKALGLYRKYFKKFSAYSKHAGLRETRRYQTKSDTEDLIMNFAISSRESLYIHLEAIDREMLYGLFHSILM